MIAARHAVVAHRPLGVVAGLGHGLVELDGRGALGHLAVLIPRRDDPAAAFLEILGVIRLVLPGLALEAQRVAALLITGLATAGPAALGLLAARLLARLLTTGTAALLDVLHGLLELLLTLLHLLELLLALLHLLELLLSRPRALTKLLLLAALLALLTLLSLLPLLPLLALLGLLALLTLLGLALLAEGLGHLAERL